METHDIIVIGSGQGGGPLAGAFARAGRRALLVERRHVGGTCINVGCTPTKTLVASARMAYLAHRAADYGVTLAGDVTVDMEQVHRRKERVVQSFRDGSEKSLARAGVEVRYGVARFDEPHTIEVRDSNGALTRHRADVIVIDTGARPRVPRIPGLADVPFLDSTTIMELTRLPEHLVVLGGGAIGLEFAQMFRRFGSRVTLLQRGTRLLTREDPDVAAGVLEILGEDGIDIRLETEVTHVREAAGAIVLETRSAELTASHLLVATGRVPNTEDLDLGRAGVTTDERGFVRVNDRLETNVSGIFALGDVAGQPQFTHVSYDDFRVLRRNLLEGGRAGTARRVIPYTIYIDPQLGRIGMTEADAVAAGHDVSVARLPMANVARAIEVGETRGFMKIVVDHRTQRILGAAVLGIEGGEIASLIQVAMLGELPYTALRDAMFAHPTLAESLNNVFRKLEPSTLPA
jgi:pyruvate/2-oxoglutarate dehydrogenase complex dihydrolipoamide dehydrogenase (E3) component